MADNINDEALQKIVELTYNNFKAKREAEKLDYDEIEQVREKYLKPLYPHTYDVNGQLRNYECCQAYEESPGRFWCGSATSADGSFIKLGLAICLYMKFLKHSNWIYIFLTILALTSCAVCFAIAKQNGFDPLASYTTFFYATSYGAFSGQYNKCQYALINNITLQASFSMSCPNGKINGSVSTTTVPAVLSTESQNSLFNCRNQRKQLDSGTNLVQPYLFLTSPTAVTYSNNNSSASITLQLDPLKYSPNQAQRQIAFIYECYDNTYYIGSIRAASDNFFYYVVIVDLFLSIIFIIFFCSEVSAEEDQIKEFRINEVGLHDFSAKVEGFHRDTLESELIVLFKHLEDKVDDEFKKGVMALSTPQVQEEIEQRQARREIYQNIYELMNKYYFRQSDMVLSFQECHQLVKKDVTPEQYQKFMNSIRRQVQFLLALRRRQVTKYNRDEIEVYFVFNNVQLREKFFAAQERDCLQDKIVTSKGQYIISQPPVPDMINWQNRYKWTKLRSFFSWLVVLIVIAGSYLFFGWVQYRQSLLSSTYNYKIDCAVLFPGVSFLNYNSILATDSNYVTCYCKDQPIFNVVSSQSNYCQTWQKQYITFTVIPLLISLGIVLVNATVGIIFRILSGFECHKHAESEQMSYAFKRGFLLMMNMGLIMILLNLNYNNSQSLKEISFIFLGRYNDFTSDWYENIGGIIVLTMVFNIAFSFIQLLFACGMSCLKTCWDTRCCCTKTTRQTKDEYIKMHSHDVFPIGERYAYLMATFFISMVFCGVIPSLVPITLVSFLLLYFTDKFLLFKYYQTPIQYTQKLHKAFLIVLYCSLMAHFALTAYFLGEPSLIANGAYFGTKYSSVSSGNTRIDNMLRTAYIIPYLVLFLIMVIYAIFRKFVGGILGSCINKCKGREGSYKSQMVQQMKLFKILSLKQIQTLKTALEVGLRKIEIKRKEKARSQIQIPGKDSTQKQIDMLAQQEQILLSSLQKLKKMEGGSPRDRQHGQKLLGLPSYEQSVQSNSLRQDQETIRYERRLRSLVFSGVVIQSRLSVPNISQIPATNKLMLDCQDSKDELHKQ